MAALSQDSIDWVIAFQNRNHWFSSCGEVVKRMQNGTPDIHDKIFLGIPIAEVLQTFHDLDKCGFLFVSPFLATARVGL